MKNIKNFLLILAIAGIVCSILSMTGVFQVPEESAKLGIGGGSLAYSIIVAIVCIVTICLVRKAKANGTSKGWDILFIVLGVLDWNVFYILGGVFGLVARR